MMKPRMTKPGIWSGWDGVGTAAVTLVGPIAYFTRAGLTNVLFGKASLAKGAGHSGRLTIFPAST
jgi:hypothetical protein